MKNAYLIANYLMVPADRMQTSTKDWMKKQDSVKYNEQITFPRNIKTDDLQTAKVILDLKVKKLLRIVQMKIQTITNYTISITNTMLNKLNSLQVSSIIYSINI